jgi:pyruvate/2-oxoglutarate dehydrogenase complex dihydrolipoamide dehydrogenase (E3) component
LAYEARRAAAFGVVIPEVTIDFGAVLVRAKRIARRYEREHRRVQASCNIERLWGRPRFEGKVGKYFMVQAGNRLIKAERVVISTGSRPRLPPLAGLESLDYLHTGNWLDKPVLPGRLVVIGGGYSGVEMSQFYRRMGAQVTLLQRGEHILPREDADVAQALEDCLEEEGVSLELKAEATGAQRQDGRVKVYYRQEGREKSLEASHLFVATGREPNTDGLALETVGVTRLEGGAIKVDEKLATSVKGIWAAGDARGEPMLSHSAFDDYRVLSSQLGGDGLRTTDRLVPSTVFSDPQLARVGMTERDALRTGQAVKVVKFDMKDNGKAVDLCETYGFIKLIVNTATRQLLGAAVLAHNGAELIHSFVDLINAGAPYTLIRDAIYIRPTFTEAVQGAAALLDG